LTISFPFPALYLSPSDSQSHSG